MDGSMEEICTEQAKYIMFAQPQEMLAHHLLCRNGVLGYCLYLASMRARTDSASEYTPPLSVQHACIISCGH